jgi:anti-sigma B factor antagonist
MTPPPPFLLLHARKAGDVTLVTVLADDLSEADAQTVGRTLDHLVEGVARPRLRLDLGRVRSLTTTALGKLVALHKRVRAAGGDLALVNVSDPVYEVLEVTRLHQFLDVGRPGTPSPVAP